MGVDHKSGAMETPCPDQFTCLLHRSDSSVLGVELFFSLKMTDKVIIRGTCSSMFLQIHTCVCMRSVERRTKCFNLCSEVGINL